MVFPMAESLKQLLILLSCVLSVLVPAMASDYSLEIFGNANLDETIDENDIEYIRGVINGQNNATELADANHDGTIDELDIAQIDLIINGQEKNLTFIDAQGKAVTIKKPIAKIVVLSDPQADAIRILGAEDKVVGISSSLADEKILLQKISELPTVGGDARGQGTDYEAILALNPDIVLPAGTGDAELEEKLNHRVSVVRFDLYKPEILPKEIMELGYILDKKSQAKEFGDFYSRILNTIKEGTANLSDNEKPRVFYCGYPSAGYRYYAILPNQWLGSVCDIAGGNNIAEDLAGPEVDPEWVMVQNPDIILVHEGSKLPSGYDTDDVSGAEKVIKQITNETGFANIDAVKKKRIYIETSDIDSGTQSFIAMAFMAKLFHPDIFKDLDPKSIHQEYLTRFQRIDYNPNEHGVFFYPPLEVV